MEQLTLFPGDSPASHSPSPDKDSAVRMTVTSGRKCSGLLTKSDPLGLLAKTLLESSVWYNPVCRLTWLSRPLFQKKIRRSLQNMNTPSRPSVRILNESDIPSNRLLFQLAVKEHRTSETGYGLLPTPKAMMVEESFDQWEQRVKRHKKSFGQGLTVRLEALMRNGLIPTPTARDWKGPQARSYHQEKMDNLPGLVRFQLGKAGPLNPLFVGEMMGFPPHWLISPFQSGARKVSGPSVMQ